MVSTPGSATLALCYRELAREIEEAVAERAITPEDWLTQG
jgi:hypothetical protein